METKCVGLIGLGLMGHSLGKRLLAAGRRVVGFDISRERQQDWSALGGEVAASVAEVAERCDVILLAVLTMRQVEDVVEGDAGIVSRAAPSSPKTVICTSTCEPDRIADLAMRVEQRGIRFVDAPVSGTSRQVLEGEGVGLIGGDARAIQDVQDILAAVYPYCHLTGEAGSGTRTKLAINLILGLNRAALAEGLVFAEKLGLDLGTFLEIARTSAAYSQVMDVKGPKMVEQDFSPVSKVSQHLKDVRVMVGQARLLGQDLPLAIVLQDLLEACERNGEGERDNAIIVREIARRRA